MNNQETQFVPVASDSGNGLITVIRSGKLITISGGEKTEATLESGSSVVGTYVGSVPNKFNPERLDYSLRGEDGTLIILAQTAVLKSQFSKVSEGELVMVTYNGKKNIVRKNGAKAEMHDFTVSRAIEAS